MRTHLAREANTAEPVSVAEPPEPADVTSTDRDGASQERSSATQTSDAAEPDESSRQLPLIKFVTLPRQTATEAIPRLQIQVLDGHTALVDAQPVPEPRYRRAWEVLTVVACFPPGEAVRTRIVELVWPAAAEETGLTERQLDGRLRTAFAQLKDVWRTYVTPEEVDQLWHAQGGIIRLNERLVRVDLHAFLWAAQEGDRAWHAGPERSAEGIAAYRRALALYTGPLLRGREQAYGWVRDFQDRYACRQRQVMHRLAELLMQSERYAEAALLWAELMRDPGPPDPERDHEDQYAYREACARAAFECCRQLGDRGRLVRTHQELLTVLQALNADAEVAEAAEPEVQTTALFQQISAELASARTARR
jgi:DNA-binding SARP family transcriptional activator